MHMSAGFKTLELSSAEIWRSHLQPIPLYKIGGGGQWNFGTKLGPTHSGGPAEC